MKLAEALQERSDLAARIEQLRVRLNNNVLVQENEAPAEAPKTLLAELDRCIARSEELMTRINLTNASVMVEGESITALLARRDCLKMQLSVWRDAINTASQTARRATRTEIKIHSAIDVAALQKRVDAVSRTLRETDNRIQAANWLNDLN